MFAASTSTQNRKWKSLLLLLVTLSDGERPGGDAWPRRIDSRGPSGLERRASEAAGMARSRRAQTRGAGDNGSGFVVAAASLRRRSLIEPAQRSSTQRNAAGCCAGTLPQRKGTASTACAAVCGSAAAHWSGHRRALIPSASAGLTSSRCDARLSPRCAARWEAAGAESAMRTR